MLIDGIYILQWKQFKLLYVIQTQVTNPLIISCLWSKFSRWPITISTGANNTSWTKQNTRLTHVTDSLRGKKREHVPYSKRVMIGPKTNLYDSWNLPICASTNNLVAVIAEITTTIHSICMVQKLLTQRSTFFQRLINRCRVNLMLKLDLTSSLPWQFLMAITFNCRSCYPETSHYLRKQIFYWRRLSSSCRK